MNRERWNRNPFQERGEEEDVSERWRRRCVEEVEENMYPEGGGRTGNGMPDLTTKVLRGLPGLTYCVRYSWSWPPKMRSTSGTFFASLRSRASLK